ncbi:hypothetical protein H112_04454 [Trichophyton rubrum D6]|uniref:Uncharacterized protein n=3 Tax=Trichophyton TaxID=5550 RepID=A0A080WJ72_TRIRC|nr:uncharacterized protein TERG_12118 [Trichophyton rubrum CBS 118892]EZF22974.1 hypothetical protein H100_04463 [Trichophyton rubrum MR850]EZF41800.1 hypothetical protein H102_04447 [Trichophyton rubrum CBS 100081]EZF52447.1 hypothetical protein H103_04458 [Trichophyton rubrum CBS 288.86]EZF63076.1 hypothetical protein H104_04446 [Trichophyton rubrum CBS 289.86]EZF73660.1 hypothetical protein H105_04472 [Trichophyton soudanense CBS 452.61]EZF84382.1 hypothetical protein H110_04449 [Trichophy
MAATKNTEGRVTPTQGELAPFQAHAKALWAGKGARSGVHRYSCIVAGMKGRATSPVGIVCRIDFFFCLPGGNQRSFGSSAAFVISYRDLRVSKACRCSNLKKTSHEGLRRLCNLRIKVIFI